MTPFVSTPPAFDAITAAGIGGLALAMAAIVAWLRGRFEGAVTGARSAVVLAMWTALVGVVAAAGALARFDRTPPPMALLLPVIFGGSIVLALSAVGRSMAQAWPLAALVGVQMFRLPLELVMHRAARLGIMPEELSYWRDRRRDRGAHGTTPAAARRALGVEPLGRVVPAGDRVGGAYQLAARARLR